MASWTHSKSGSTNLKSNSTSKSSSSSRSGSNPRPDWVPDPHFYYDLHTFEVDFVRFRIPTHFLLASGFFRKMLHVDPPAAGTVEDICDVDHIEGVTAIEFRDFLRVLMPAPCKADGTFAPGPTSWVNVLRLASQWGFTHMRELAIRQIDLDPDCVVRLDAARRYKAHELLPRALEDIVERAAPLEVEEFNLLELELAVNVTRYREAVYRLPNSDSRQKPDGKTSLIEGIFGPEFARDWELGKAMARRSSQHA
ncbi:hypothetical protein BD309DRAFT_957306 [Dichomitus squalens]|uniref:BTB domain-containing protein n=2 Tax=Dichomitus squalens TaxID=114155 RepID=A0A4Q9PQ58_9APHY|nr:uncharacterized protein DICSQDRAFT_182819 [Dichomitus squalens LYAD-421 SS1]EJF57976.1 hypothetical protein DICSQDRAFT_182819 [Dichomitus squalens LYAD-421 SS1]TBU29226.1 hypothetical protein BD311DRAFT_777604 [Dichomitus squalens]TBU44955.1 hypothetical protein BD309DRAFT_957306 [Dichomitus squalens]TBU56489.1 hypothetical protein BD310DRAFT_931265 [Dichomitus squalens]